MLHAMLAVGLVLAPEPPKDLESRVAELEKELEKQRLRAEDEDVTVPTAAPPPSANVFNPTLTVIGNALYRYDDQPVEAGHEDEHAEGEAPERVDKTFDLREIELDLRAAVDPFADGVAIIALHSDVPGAGLEVEIEEGFVLLKSLPLPALERPPLGLKLKIGRFRADVGRVNRLHLHDLPQVDRPLVLEELYGPEGYVANGLSAQVFLPFGGDESAFELTAQLLSGGGAPVVDGSPRDPAFVGHLRWFRALGAAHSLDLALVFHYGRPEADVAALVYGADLFYRWRPLRGGERRSFIVGAQVLRADVGEVAPLGWYAFAQVQLSRGTYLGARFDDAAHLDDDTVRRRAVSGYLTWYASEFLRFRAGYQRRASDLDEEDGRNSAFAELAFLFGAHPAHPYWVNR
jgi:hypothetical protein